MDVAVLRALDAAPPWLAPVALGITFLGDFGGVFLLIGLYHLVFGRGQRRHAGAVILGALLLVLIVVDLVLKPLVHRPRPFEVLGMGVLTGPVPQGYSFPSGHTTAIFAGAIAWIRTMSPAWRLRLAALLYAALVGWSRIYLGAHWPSDVLAGALFGVALGYLTERYIPSSFLGGAT